MFLLTSSGLLLTYVKNSEWFKHLNISENIRLIQGNLFRVCSIFLKYCTKVLLQYFPLNTSKSCKVTTSLFMFYLKSILKICLLHFDRISFIVFWYTAVEGRGSNWLYKLTGFRALLWYYIALVFTNFMHYEYWRNKMWEIVNINAHSSLYAVKSFS